ncbi:hypothetical protein N7530_003998 [Penicillium desertorum]|uniref:Uncharacterized protein n=1 Tax=Penicillium desertorum TaxID=1303715 RepID=A0A9X0BPZ4_9EURO|nr:hypothetical protein N7530_003998 [Penicillium desertorum]
MNKRPRSAHRRRKTVRIQETLNSLSSAIDTFHLDGFDIHNRTRFFTGCSLQNQPAETTDCVADVDT